MSVRESFKAHGARIEDGRLNRIYRRTNLHYAPFREAGRRDMSIDVPLASSTILVSPMCALIPGAEPAIATEVVCFSAEVGSHSDQPVAPHGERCIYATCSGLLQITYFLCVLFVCLLVSLSLVRPAVSHLWCRCCGPVASPQRAAWCGLQPKTAPASALQT